MVGREHSYAGLSTGCERGSGGRKAGTEQVLKYRVKRLRRSIRILLSLECNLLSSGIEFFWLPLVFVKSVILLKIYV